MKRIIAIDPGNIQSAVVVLYDDKIEIKQILPNNEMLNFINSTQRQNSVLCIEQIKSYGMAVGASVFDTCFWSGRFVQIWNNNFILIPRIDIKIHFCGTTRAKDKNIRQALIDRLGEPGTKKSPGATYGISKDLWSALAIAIYANDKKP